MTRHQDLKMYHEDRRITDQEIIKAILSANNVARIALHDEPYPYIVAMNYGYEWEKELVLYFHMAVRGHRIDLIRKNPNVAVNISAFLDRVGHKNYRKEPHDYRSVNVFGRAEIISPIENPDEFLHGLSVLCRNNFRPGVAKITEDMKARLFVLKITAEQITAKSQYPISTVEEAEMPENSL